jgi:outer membrane protein
MNKLLKIAFILSFLMISFGLSAQNKMGHINSNDLLVLIPERKQAETTLQEYAKQLEDQLKTMSGEYDAKVQEYQSKEATMSDLVKQDKVREIGNLEQRIKDFQAKAQEDLQKKEAELLKPIIDKAKKAIEDVAKEGGYRYIFDTSAGVVLYMEESDNIMNQVKKKLGLN